MKKILILFVLLNISIFAFGTEPGDITYEPKIGIQINVVIDNVNLFDFEAAKFVNLDVYKRVSGRLDLGLGIQWNEVATTKTSGGLPITGTLTRIPVYGVAKFHLAKTFPVNPYIKVLAGYQMMIDSDVEGVEGGSYYGAGIGLEMGYVVIDYAYTVESNEGASDFRGAIGHALAIGYRF